MIFNKDTKILIVGMGLMGGSYAQALTAAGYEVGALARRQESIDYALEKGYIRHGKSEVDGEYIAGFDLIVFALYPHILLDWLRENQQFIKSGALLTDVTGVKGSVVYSVQELLRNDLEFIGAHPMAGRESSGVEYASCAVFKGANYIVVPTGKNTPEAMAACRDLGVALGFKTVSELTPELHDEMVAFLSQLTHCIAVALMVCKDATHLVDYTGDSFRDLTRIAKINDEMWSELFILNKSELLSQMDLFSEKFALIRESIERSDTDTLRSIMRLSAQRRKFFDKEAASL